ncbi:sulfotransferase family protein [Reichenbachiella ulvae]|uniref:Sulfotransferase n=1 Tax=Reichenbachiella ulvae TaxID=2980104 RepID=A0ABT3CY08_9BACT|nr:sulfotransferase [Reichenbachiella ulvae]MCV9388484.1 sulfotransferase [Reichenbachiella ulvae]
MNRPDFIIVGSAKAGTTALFNYLKGHPDIFIPEIKECRFFSGMSRDYKGMGAEKFTNAGVRNLEEYRKLFAGVPENVKCGDLSTDYLYYYKTSVNNILKYIGEEAKIIIVLRDPARRAFSNYSHHVRDLTENLSFADALNSEEQRIRDNWSWGYHYFKVGLYYEQVKYYLENFRNVKIFLYEDFNNIDRIIEELLNFIGVDASFKVSSPQMHNVSGAPKSMLLQKFLLKRSGLKNVIKLVIPSNFRRIVKKRLLKRNLSRNILKDKDYFKLRQKYKEDIHKLESLINRDLSNWYS